MQFLLVLVLAVARYSSSGQSFQGVSVLDPVHVVIPLPQDDTSDFGRNPFQLSIPKVRPVVDLALEQAYKMSYVPRNSIAVTYRDSKLSDAHGPNVAVEQYVKKQIDCIIGYAFVYALAPVARMTPFWGNGIPVITPIGLTMNLDDKTEYQLMTRISSPYKLAANAVKELFVQMTWKRHVFMFHHAKTTPSVPVGECFMLMASIQTMLRDVLEMQHNFYMFNEESSQARADKRAEYKEILTQSSFVANGESIFQLVLS